MRMAKARNPPQWDAISRLCLVRDDNDKAEGRGMQGGKVKQLCRQVYGGDGTETQKEITMETIYYYKDYDGVWHFSTGVTRTDETASQYLRMLRYSHKEVSCLYPDIPEDRARICELFGYNPSITWKDIYHNNFE